MEIKMTEKQFRRLLDLVYIGNWVLPSTRGDDRIKECDQVERLVFANCLDHGMAPLTELYQGELIPSRAFADGGIHEAIEQYEDSLFYELLAEELAREMGGAESGGELNAGGLRTPDAGAGALDTMERTRQRSREAVRPR